MTCFFLLDSKLIFFLTLCLFLVNARNLMHPGSNVEDCVLAGQYYSSLISPSVAQSMIKRAKFRHVKKHIVQEFVEGHQVETLDVQKTLDDCGISRGGYTQLFRIIKSTLKKQRIHSNILPKPFHVRKERLNLNEQVCDFIGQPYSVNGVFDSGSRNMVFSQANNIFYSLNTLQKTMVKYYDMTTLETNSVLKFVIKLDECEVLKEKKMERVTITLMNRALSPSLDNEGRVDKKDPKHFSVQSENHIWWLGCFQVCH